MGYLTLMNLVQAGQDLLKVVPTGPFVKRPTSNPVEDVTISHEF